jgi:hypothetical protein
LESSSRIISKASQTKELHEEGLKKQELSADLHQKISGQTENKIKQGNNNSLNRELSTVPNVEDIPEIEKKKVTTESKRGRPKINSTNKEKIKTENKEPEKTSIVPKSSKRQKTQKDLNDEEKKVEPEIQIRQSSRGSTQHSKEKKTE